MTAVVIATCSELPTGDADGDRLMSALADAGVEACWQVWNDPAATWDDTLVVVRSTWDYTTQRAAFVAWTRGIARLANPADVIAWNSDKAYLQDLAAAGVPIVPTEFVAPGEPFRLPVGGEFIVKPSVGAGASGGGHFASGDADRARKHVAVLHEAGRVVLVQPYLADVDTAGETALIYIDGRFSHAVRKGALLTALGGVPSDLRLSDALARGEQITAREPSAAEVAVGEQAMSLVRSRFGADLLYARVDLLPTPDGPVVIELELTEPSLFLGYSPGAADRFAAAIAARG